MKPGKTLLLAILITQLLVGGCASGAADPALQATATPSGIRLPPQWTATPWPDPASEVAQEPVDAWAACPDDPETPLSVLKAGTSAMVTPDVVRPVQLRDIAGWVGSQEVAVLQPGEMVEILEGPVCLDQFVWWRVQSASSGAEGWVIEGNQYQSWLLPPP